MSFSLTDKQQEAMATLAGPATHIMLFGGSRSGKTFLLCRAVAMRAMKAPDSRHAILRFRFNHVKNSIVLDTWPKMMKLCFPSVYSPDALNKTDWFYQFPNGSQVWFGGLDDKERTEKILGMEFITIYLNECSQIPQPSRDLVLTRLAQLAEQIMTNRAPTVMPLRMYYDCNPPSKAHWTYKLFVKKLDLDTGKPTSNPEDYAHFQINPIDNAKNLSPNYLKMLEGLSARMRKRFVLGEYGEITENALFNDADFDKWRVVDASELPQLVRVVISVDPSGSGDKDNAHNDEIGIMAGGLGVDGNGYLLEDCTVKAGPATWGRVATDAFDRLEANHVVGEVNFGGAMVQHVIETARPRTPYKEVRASRGKSVRAEPLSALVEQGKIRHVGNFSKLEGELVDMTTNGYIGEASPNRADAWVWLFTELFPNIVNPANVSNKIIPGGISLRGGSIL